MISTLHIVVKRKLPYVEGQKRTSILQSQYIIIYCNRGISLTVLLGDFGNDYDVMFTSKSDSASFFYTMII